MKGLKESLKHHPLENVGIVAGNNTVPYHIAGDIYVYRDGDSYSLHHGFLFFGGKEIIKQVSIPARSRYMRLSLSELLRDIASYPLEIERIIVRRLDADNEPILKDDKGTTVLAWLRKNTNFDKVERERRCA